MDAQFWLVRSPWPPVDVREVMEPLAPWVYAREGRDPYFDRQQHLELVREFLTLDEKPSWLCGAIAGSPEPISVTCRTSAIQCW